MPELMLTCLSQKEAQKANSLYFCAVSRGRPLLTAERWQTSEDGMDSKVAMSVQINAGKRNCQFYNSVESWPLENRWKKMFMARSMNNRH